MSRSARERALIQQGVDLGGYPLDAFRFWWNAAAVLGGPLPTQSPHACHRTVAHPRVGVEKRMREGFSPFALRGDQPMRHVSTLRLGWLLQPALPRRVMHTFDNRAAALLS